MSLQLTPLKQVPFSTIFMDEFFYQFAGIDMRWNNPNIKMATQTANCSSTSEMTFAIFKLLSSSKHSSLMGGIPDLCRRNHYGLLKIYLYVFKFRLFSMRPLSFENGANGHTIQVFFSHPGSLQLSNFTPNNLKLFFTSKVPCFLLNLG